MTAYVARRLIQTIGLLFLLSVVLFALVNLAPGGPLAGHGQSRHINPEKVELLKRQFGLDKPLPTQYLIWLVGNDWMEVDLDGDGIAESRGTRKGILRGDFGFSFRTRNPVLDRNRSAAAQYHLPDGYHHAGGSVDRHPDWHHLRHSPIFFLRHRGHNLLVRRASHPGILAGIAADPDLLRLAEKPVHGRGHCCPPAA